jgi:hypothetical protein
MILEQKHPNYGKRKIKRVQKQICRYQMFKLVRKEIQFQEQSVRNNLKNYRFSRTKPKI